MGSTIALPTIIYKAKDLPQTAEKQNNLETEKPEKKLTPKLTP